MAKLTLTDLTSLTSNEASAIATLNANFALIEAALETTLSRDGTTPNSMSADLDMNSQDILNVGTIVSTNDAVATGILFDWESLTTDTDQGAGKLWFDNATLASVTTVYIDDVEAGGTSVNAMVDTFDDSTATIKGTIVIRDLLTPTVFAVYNVTGSVTSASTYSKVAVTHVASSGSFTDGNKVDVNFLRAGDDGLINNIVEDTTPQLGGPLDTNSQQVQWSKGADVASAAALPILTDGNSFDITGTTAVTSINTTGKVGTLIVLQFDGALTLTHHATDLILPKGANITTAAGDVGVFLEYASGDFYCVSYQRQGGILVADLATGTDGELITWDAAGAPATVTAGTTGQVLTSNGAGAAPTFQTLSQQGWELVETENHSSAQTATFDHTVVTGYDYKITIHGGQLDSDSTEANAPALQWGTGAGPSWRTTAYESYFTVVGTTTQGTSNITTGAAMYGHTADNMGGAANEIFEAEWTLFEPAENQYHYVRGRSSAHNSGSTTVMMINRCGVDIVEAITAFRVTRASGNWSGTVKLWRRSTT